MMDLEKVLFHDWKWVNRVKLGNLEAVKIQSGRAASILCHIAGIVGLVMTRLYDYRPRFYSSGHCP
jgi:hypothetical protein